jgi:4-diphosphocytidyl-2-C-methyl-D-erythritol kinase
MDETAYAKINLALHVRGREADGYHRIETIFAFAEHGDVLRVGPGEELSLDVEGQFAAALQDGENNLVLRAARALREHCDVNTGAALTLEKRLPIASGIGGGSADGAAALRLLNRFWDLRLNEAALTAIGHGLGADVPACVASRTAIGKGRGDELIAADGLLPPDTPLLLINPGVALSTAAVFGRWRGKDGGPLPDDWRVAGNDLQEAALGLAPEIETVLEALGSIYGASAARMSGSGATCFALFETEADRDAADARIGAGHPGWWRLATRTR